MKPQLIGKVFERLTVIEYLKDRNGYRGYYRCLCNCGKTVYTKSYELKNGHIKSCGCYLRELKAKESALPGLTAQFNWIYSKYKREAKGRKLEFKITKAQFTKLIKKDCNYCGLPPSGRFTCKLKIKDVSEFKYSGLDRVDNTQGYILNNCVPCCKICNRAKSSLLKDEWTSWITRLVKFHNRVKN